VTTQRDDDRLREAFQALRAESEQAGRVPGFAAMLGEAKRQAEARPNLEVIAGGRSGPGPGLSRRRFLRAGAWASAVLAAAVAGLILIDRAPAGEEDFERLVAAYASETVGGAWSSPTSGLLEVPGMDLMRSLPSIGAPVRGLDPSSLPPRTSAPEEENL
jgi:hypothetical protein